MKKFLSLPLAALILTASLAACAPAADKLDPAITLTSSAARSNAEWLDERLDVIPDDVVVGIGSNADYGIDMSEFDDDGYIARAIGGEVLLFGKTEDGLDRAVREYAKAADVGATAELDTVYHEGVRIKKLTIADRDISEYTIIYNYDRDVKNIGADSPTFGNTQYAAQELKRLVLQATGIDLTIKTFADKVTGPVISIDYYEGGDLGENGFTYKVEGGNIYIEGVGKANGCANAVYYLLEHECGWDALLFGDSDLQESDHVDIPDGVEKKVEPMFDYLRVVHNARFDYFQSDKSDFSDTYLGSVGQASHAIGKWAGTPRQNICYTDETVFSDVCYNIIDYIAANVDAGRIIGEDLTDINMGVEDDPNYCMCESCKERYIEENRTYSGGVVRFVNAVSEEVGETYPGMRYLIFAYTGSNAPCKTAPRDDVYITFCTDDACANHAFEGSDCSETVSEYKIGQFRTLDPKNKDYDMINNDDHARWMKGWAELTKNVIVYHYMLPGNFAEYTYIETLYDDIHFMGDLGLMGFAPEAQYSGLGLNRLRFQLIMEIVWHPEMTEKEYEIKAAECLRREYGDGYSYVGDFIDLWRQTEYGTGCWSTWIYNDLIATYYNMELYAELAPKMYGYLEEALKLCSTADQEDHVKRLMVDVLYKECYTQYFKAYDAGDTEKIGYLEGRYDLFVDCMTYCGYDFTKLPTRWSFGPTAYQPVWNSDTKILATTLEEAAWTDWYDWRDKLSAKGAEQKPMPEKYVEYWETAED